MIYILKNNGEVERRLAYETSSSVLKCVEIQGLLALFVLYIHDSFIGTS